MASRTAFVLTIASLIGISVCAEAAPVFTSKSRFRIPYKYEPNEMARLGAKEIRLYVSTDRGVRWQQAMAVSPETGRFDYEAAGEGEFWFAVRTLDGANRLHPQGQIIEPELKVVVDQTPPELDIQLQQVVGGKVQLSWKCSDDHLNVRELRLECLQPGETVWHTVGIIPQESGQISWAVAQAGVVAVRGTVSDLAGNVGRGQNQLRVDGGVSLPGRPGVPDLRQPVAETPKEPNTLEDPNATTSTSRPMDPFGQPVKPMPRAVPNADPAFPAASGTSQAFVSDEAGRRPDVVSGRYPSGGSADGAGSELPVSGPKSRFVNSRKFHIAYAVDDVGPSGVSAVELFITEDNGRKWFKYGADPDNQSPFEVEVPRDGAYGFAIRVRSGAGLAADPPQPGEGPSIIVVCDQVAPQVQLFAPQQGRGDNLNKILIRWKASDDNLPEKSIALSYAVDPAGPWQPIADPQPNTGSYVWTVGPNVPARIFVRVVARDTAGNLGKADTPEPVVVDLTKPTARIVDVETNELSTFPR